MPDMDAFAEVHRILPNLWAIDEIGKTILYVFEGSRRALLVDTGFGLLDLPAMLAELCPGKEPVVVNTHAHGDHNGGNRQFSSVLCGRVDEPFNHAAPDQEDLERFRKAFFEGNPRAAKIDPGVWSPGPSQNVIPLADGDIIDLGGIALEVLETPGHTIGSICLLDRANGLLFTGDMVLTWQVWGQLARSSALKCYAQSLQRMATLAPGLKRVLPAHGVRDNPFGWPIYDLPPEVLSVYAQGTRDIVEGRVAGEPFNCFAGNGLVKLFDVGGMVYDPGRIGNGKY